MYLKRGSPPVRGLLRLLWPDEIQPFLLLGEKQRRVDDRQMRIGLREVSQLFLGVEIEMFAEQPQVIAVSQDLAEILASLRCPVTNSARMSQKVHIVNAELGTPKSSSLL